MLKNEYLKQWTRIVSEKMRHLSIPQVVGLATWSFGMVMTKSSSLTKVAQLIARVNGEKVAAVRQRLREWYEEAEAKKGLHRRSLDVSTCFAPLLMWVLSLLPTNIEQIALALDVTTIGSKFVVLIADVKSDGWQWHNTRLLDPQRTERMPISDRCFYSLDGYAWWRG